MTLEDARGQIAEALWEANEPIDHVELTSETVNILETAAEAARMRGHSALEAEHVTYGLACSSFEITSRVLHMVRVDRQNFLQASEQLLSNGHCFRLGGNEKCGVMFLNAAFLASVSLESSTYPARTCGTPYGESS